MQAATSTNKILTAEMASRDAETHVNNAILYRLPGTKTDIEDVTELMRVTLLKNLDKPTKAFRLGKKNEYSQVRPIKLVFSDEQDKWNFIKRANHGQRSDKMFCKKNVTKEQRNEEYRLRGQIRILWTEQEGSGGYRIKNLSIEKKKTLLRNWEKLNSDGTSSQTEQ